MHRTRCSESHTKLYDLTLRRRPRTSKERKNGDLLRGREVQDEYPVTRRSTKVLINVERDVPL